MVCNDICADHLTWMLFLHCVTSFQVPTTSQGDQLKHFQLRSLTAIFSFGGGQGAGKRQGKKEREEERGETLDDNCKKTESCRFLVKTQLGDGPGKVVVRW